MVGARLRFHLCFGCFQTQHSVRASSLPASLHCSTLRGPLQTQQNNVKHNSFLLCCLNRTESLFSPYLYVSGILCCLCVTLGTVLAALASSPPPQHHMVVCAGGFYCSTISSFVLPKLSCTWVFAAHADAILGSMTSLLLSLANTEI